MDTGNANQALELLRISEFADFAYSFYLFTLHRAYGSISGTETSDRLLKESVGLTVAGKSRLDTCGAYPPSCLSHLRMFSDLQNEILKGAMQLHFPDAPDESLHSALRVSEKGSLENMTLVYRTGNLLRRASLVQLFRRFVTISMTENGGIIITFHISERKQVWLFRVLRAALLSIVMSRGNLRSSKLLFCLFSTAWIIQRIVRFTTKRWLSVTRIVNHVTGDVAEDTDRKAAMLSSPNPNEIVEGSVRYVFRQSLFLVVAFCISMNPNYQL